MEPETFIELESFLDNRETSHINVIQDGAIVEENFSNLRESGFLRQHFLLVLLVALFVCVGAYAGFSGNFPLNDDWLYGSAIEKSLQLGRFSTICGNVFNVLPSLMAYVVCTIIGFSYEYLRILTGTLAIFGALALYGAGRELGASRPLCALASACFLLNPMSINLSYSFMSDMPAFAINNMFFFISLKCLKKKHNYLFWFLSLLFLILSISCRQTAALYSIPLLAAFFMQKVPLVAKLTGLIIVVFSVFLSYKYFEALLVSGMDLPEAYGIFSEAFFLHLFTNLAAPMQILLKAWFFVARAASYLALMSLPLIAVAIYPVLAGWRRSSRILVIAGIIAAFITAVPLLYMGLGLGELMPYSLNLFEPPYLGSYTLIGDLAQWTDPQRLILLSVAAGLGAFLLVFELLFLSLTALFGKKGELTENSQNSKSGGTQESASAKEFPPFQTLDHTESQLPKSEEIFICLTLFLSLSYIFVQSFDQNFDRYYLFALSPLILCFLQVLKSQNLSLRLKRAQLLSAGLCLSLGVSYGAIALKDQMNFNRAKWFLIGELEKAGVSPEDIDGGYQYNVLANPRHILNTAEHDVHNRGWKPLFRGRTRERQEKRWFAVNNEKYIVSKQVFANCKVVRTKTYWSPIESQTRTLFVLTPEEQ